MASDWSLCLKAAKSEASATLAGREFHTGIVLGKKLCLKVSDLAARCRNLSLWLDLSLDGAAVRYSAAGMSTRSLTILKKRVSWSF